MVILLKCSRTLQNRNKSAHRTPSRCKEGHCHHVTNRRPDPGAFPDQSMKYMKTFALPGDLSIAVDALGMFPLPSTAHSGPQFFHKPCLVLSQASMEEGRLSHNRAWKNMAVLWTPDACSQVPSARRGTVSPHHSRGPTTWLQHPLPTFLVG